MSEHSEEAEIARDSKMGKAILKGITIGFPLSLLAMTLAVWLITDLELAEAFTTALLPGVLLGGFAGGFAGIASTMD